MTTALVVGKFYPPHYGHMHVIRRAAVAADKVIVLVMGSKYDSIRLVNRAWCIHKHMLKEGHENVVVKWQVCEVPMNLESHATWMAQVESMKSALGDEKIDFVFSSETYGEELAEYFSAEHVMVDLHRIVVPTSGMAIRGDVTQMWGFLPSEVRADLTVKAVFVGAESTGTTTISQRVWRHYHERNGVWARGQWIPEYGRDYTVDMLANMREVLPNAGMDNLCWTHRDFVNIASGQNALETQALSQGSPLLVCDTDAHATALWERRYVNGNIDEETVEIASRAQPADIYFLTDHEGVPFVQDGIRDGEHIRADMTQWFKDYLNHHKMPWVMLTGSIEDRMQVATDVLDHLIKNKTTFNDPI